MNDLPRQTALMQTFLNSKAQHANAQAVHSRFSTYFQLLRITNSYVALEVTLVSDPCAICTKKASTSTGGFRVNCCHKIVCGRDCFRKYVYEATSQTLLNMEYVTCPMCNNYLGKEICVANFTEWEIYINTQKAKGDTHEEPRGPQTFLCAVHYDDMPLSDAVPLSCSHKICKECVQGHIEAQIAERKAFILCPVSGCTELLTDYHVRKLAPMLYEAFQRFSFEGSRDALAQEDESVFTCPSVNCPNLIIVPKLLMDYTCSMCSKRYCPQCQNVVHNGMTCTQYFAFLQEEQHRKTQNQQYHAASGRTTQKDAKPARRRSLRKNDAERRKTSKTTQPQEEQRRKMQNQQDDAASAAYFQDLASKKYRQCPKCHVWIERAEGCKYMTCLSPTCRGKTYFCMECMQQLKSKHGAHKCVVEGYAFI